jgi:hypothetical protein
MPETDKPSVTRKRKVLREPGRTDKPVISCTKKMADYIHRRVDMIKRDLERVEIEKRRLDDERKRLEAKKQKLMAMLDKGGWEDGPEKAQQWRTQGNGL